ncbi:MAG: DUF423 domain-containing protein [Bacteroidetes bacterium]|nr:DUF423 domain-containing protein [Bacteroidota bacterium]
MNQKQTLVTGALLGMLGVAFGAFGAHALKPLLTQLGRLETFELAVRYHFYHAFALLIIGLLMDKWGTTTLRWSSLLLFFGVFFFSGSLYFFSLTNVTAFAMITPVGGVLMIAGWATCVAALVKGAAKN